MSGHQLLSFPRFVFLGAGPTVRGPEESFEVAELKRADPFEEQLRSFPPRRTVTWRQPEFHQVERQRHRRRHHVGDFATRHFIVIAHTASLPFTRAVGHCPSSSANYEATSAPCRGGPRRDRTSKSSSSAVEGNEFLHQGIVGKSRDPVQAIPS